MRKRLCLRNWRALFVMSVLMSVSLGLLTGCPDPPDPTTGPTPVAVSPTGVSGAIIVPSDPAPYLLAVDGDAMTMNANLSDGNWEWYRFEAEAGRKYYILAQGNAPINLMLFKGVPLAENDEDDEDDVAADMAVMLWTTDPAQPQFYYSEWPEQRGKSALGMKTYGNQAIAVPSFVAHETTTYYIVVQAAKILACLPNCTEDEVRMAAYYDVRTYNIQVSTVAEAADANELTVYDPAQDEAPFLKGEVKINKHDWFYFDAEAESSYMIEFMEPLFSRGRVSAYVYSPLGDITCEVIDCDNCFPQPLYTPRAGRYFILVALNAAPNESGYVELSLDEEFFGFEYLLRVFHDDHGNLPALATRVNTPDLNEESEVAGYLTRGDEDWFDFVATPYSTFWVETRGQYDLRLNVSGNVEDEPFDDDALGLAAFLKRNIDGRNDMAIFQTNRREEVLPFSVQMVHKPLNPFKIDMGDYFVAVIGDDHVDAHLANTGRATPIVAGGAGNGILWPVDTDMFVFKAVREHFMYKVDSQGANRLDVRTINQARTAFVLHDVAEWPEGRLGDKELTVYLNNEDSDNDAFVVASGVDEGVHEADYSITYEEDDHRNFTNEFDDDMAVATVVSPDSGGAGILWPNDSDVFKVIVGAGNVGKMIEVTLTVDGGANTVDLLWWPPNAGTVLQQHTFWVLVPDEDEYGIVVRHNGTRPNRIVNYTIAVRFETVHNYTGVFDTDMERATRAQETTTKEFWPGDSDVYKINITQANIDEGREVYLRLTTVPNDANLWIRWWESGNPPAPVASEVILPTPTTPGEYGIIVEGTTDSIVNYTLQVELRLP